MACRGHGEAKDKDLALLCLRPLHPAHPDAFWDPALCVEEMERCAAKGSHAFAFSEDPEPLGLPTIHDKDGCWDPVMAAANDLEMVVCTHVGSSSTMQDLLGLALHAATTHTPRS